jgi:Schlafen, AlbA_2
MTASRITLIDRLQQREDTFTERKPNVDSRDVRRTLVGFANTVPEDRTAILFVGVADSGEPLGLDNIESAQKKISRICGECYPAFDPWPFLTSLEVNGKHILAVEVSRSKMRPHFTGKPYVRDGSQTVAASEQIFRDMLTSHCSKAGTILTLKDQMITITHVGVEIGRYERFILGTWTDYRCRIVNCTPHFVEFRWNNAEYSVELELVTITSDPEGHRPYKLIVRHPRA